MGGAGDIGGLLAIEDLRDGWQGVFHPSFDGNGNLMALHEATTGNMVAAYEYDPFGNPVRTSGVYAKENPIRFSGKYFDNETGLTYFGFRYYSASLGRFINRDLLEERGAWNLYSGLKQYAADPYAGASGVEGTSWSTEWEQAQDRLLSNTSLPHTTQSVTFDGKRNSGLPKAAERNQKRYSANATGHYPQGGAPRTGPRVPMIFVDDPAIGNIDLNWYIYGRNNPVNYIDPTGLAAEETMTIGVGLAAADAATGGAVAAGATAAAPAVATAGVTVAAGGILYTGMCCIIACLPATGNYGAAFKRNRQRNLIGPAPETDIKKAADNTTTVTSSQDKPATTTGAPTPQPADTTTTTETFPAPAEPATTTESFPTPADNAPTILSTPNDGPMTGGTLDAKPSGKEKADDIPSWVQGQKPQDGESGKDFAGRLLDAKYGKGKYNTGPGSEYNKLKKYADRWRANNN